MKITKIVIKKFRSIERAEIWGSSINAIVGQNNSGKSCLLRALNSFFNYEKEEAYFKNGSHTFAPKTVSKIEIQFNEIDKSKINTKYLKNDMLIVEASFTLNKETGCTRALKYQIDKKWHLDPEIINEVKKQLDFVLIPPNRDAANLESIENSILQLLVEEKMEEATESRDIYTSKFKQAIEHLENNALKKISTDTKTQLPISKPFQISIKYKKLISYKNFISDIGISISEEGLTHDLKDCGSGIQSLTTIALYNLLGKMKDKDIIIGLEEPETNLHPQSQRELIDHFKELLNREIISQLFFTTHSPQMIDKVDHTDIILFRKKKTFTEALSVKS